MFLNITVHYFFKVTIKRVTIFGAKKKKRQRILKNSPISYTENESMVGTRKFQKLETLISPLDFTRLNSPKSVFNDLIDDNLTENDAGNSIKNINITREVTKGSIHLSIDAASDV